jgi:autotransporter-associated beta strand protein
MQRYPDKISILSICLVVSSLAVSPIIAATLTWDSDPSTTGPQGGNGNWDTNTANWWNGSADVAWTNANGDSVVFGLAGGITGVVTLVTAPPGIVVNNIGFNTNYALANSASVLVLTNTPTITTAAGTSNYIASILAGSGYVKEGSGVLMLNPSGNNTNVGRVTVNNGTLQSGNSTTTIYVNGDLQVNPNGVFRYTAAAVGLGGPVAQSNTIILNGGTTTNAISATVFFINKLVLDNNAQILDGTAAGYFTATNIDARSGNIYASRYRGGAINIFKSTASTVIVSNRPNTAASDGHVVTLNAGTLIFDKSMQSANRLLVGGLLTLGGGTLMLSNANSSVNPSAENPSAAGTLLKPGASFIVGTNAGTGGNLTMGAIARNTGSTLDVRKTGTGSYTTTSANVNGIQGGWGTFSNADWLVGTTLAPYTAYTTSIDPSTWLATNNVSLSGSPSPNVTTTTINSLRLTGASTVTLNDSSQVLTLSSGGLLVTGSGATTITGGTLKGASAADLIVIQNSSADLTLNSALADNGTASSLTKSGPGKLILAPASNGMTGSNFLNLGTLEVNDLSLLASGPLVMNAGILRYTGGSTTSSRAVIANGVGAAFDISNPATTLTQSSAINGSGAAMGDLGGLAKIGPGTLILTASNYYSGITVVSNGTLLVNGTNAYNTATWNAGNVAVYGGTLGGTGLVAGSVAVKSGGTLSPGASPGTLMLGTNLTLEAGSTNIFDVTNSPGVGDLLVVHGDLAVSNSTVVINVAGSTLQPGTYTLIQYSGAKSGSFNPTVVLAGGSVNGSPVIDESTPGQINLVIKHEIVITSQPADSVTSTNGPASFTVAATGTAPLSYQWYFYGDNTNNTPSALTDATNATFNIASAQGSDSGYYAVVVTNDYSSVTSRAAILFVGNVAPIIVSGPSSQTVIAGNSASFAVSVVGNPIPALQWQTNGVDVSGATTSSLTLNNVPYAFDGMTVSLIASNVAGVVTNSATLTVIVTPVITPQPTNLVANVGDSVSLISGATGVPAPTFQWYKNGVAISGQTGSTLTFASAQGSNNGSYYLVATNTAGVATSSVVTLIVNSVTLAPITLSPSNGATGICVDTPLYISFNDSVSTVNAGKIRIYDAASPATPVDTLDMSSNTVVVNANVGVYNVQSRNVAGTAYRALPVMIISSNVGEIFPHAGVLTTNHTYYVTIDSGVFQDSGGAYFSGLTNTTAWQFTTKATGPANPTNLIVAADGTGDFSTVQGALDFLPASSATPRIINIRNGVYTEIVYINSKTNITLIGQNRDQTLITYPNNDPLNAGTALRPSFRASGADLALVNLTLTNSTPKGGSQAEALRTDGKRIILLDVRLASFQDTILMNNVGDLVYIRDSLIQGDTDFIWGGSTSFITNCEIRTLTSGTQVTQARTTNPTNGFSFVGCQITRSNASITGCGFGRDLGFTDNNVAFINCVVGDHISGWLNADARDWEYGLTNSIGQPTNYNGVQLTNGDSRLTLALSATNWLYGWNPLLAPIVLTNPTSLSVAGGASASFSVVAVGLSSPSYQWIKDGSPVSDATNATLVIASAHAGDAGSYTVVVSNEVGTATSSAATLTVGNTAPTLNPISDQSIIAGQTLNIPAVASDPDVPTQTLNFSLLAGPTNATIDPGTGVFTWRPLIPQAGATYLVTVKAADNGSPSLSATQSFNVTVTAPAQPGVSSSFSGGLITVSVTGDSGPDYAVQASTNLFDWQTIFTTNSPALPFNYTDPATAAYPVRFYRIVAGPPLP